MANENYNFNYTISNIDIEQGTFNIQYIPEDSANLTSITLNQSLYFKNYTDILDSEGKLIYSSQEDVPFAKHIEYTVDITKPILSWKRQYSLQQNINEIISANGKMIVDTTTFDSTKV